MTRRRQALVLLGSGLLAGCATPLRRAADSYAGRLAVRIEGGRGDSANFELRGSAEAGQIELSTAIGTLVARARWDPAEVVLATSDSERRYPDLDALTREMLGESVPVAALFDWLRGRPWAGAPSRSTEAGFEQMDWQVDTHALAEGLIVAVRQRAPQVTVRVRLDQMP